MTQTNEETLLLNQQNEKLNQISRNLEDIVNEEYEDLEENFNDSLIKAGSLKEQSKQFTKTKQINPKREAKQNAKKKKIIIGSVIGAIGLLVLVGVVVTCCIVFI